jgi:hypothetical protein
LTHNSEPIMQLYLIRHGQSTNNYLLEQTGAEDGRSFDPELTPLGVRQAAVLAEFLKCQAGFGPEQPHSPKTIQLTHLYASPMVRAIGTGLPTARALGLPLVAWKDLHEGGGLYLQEEGGEPLGQPGPNRAAMQRLFPELVWPAEMGEEGWWNRPFEEKEERLPRAALPTLPSSIISWAPCSGRAAARRVGGACRPGLPCTTAPSPGWISALTVSRW